MASRRKRKSEKEAAVGSVSRFTEMKFLVSQPEAIAYPINQSGFSLKNLLANLLPTPLPYMYATQPSCHTNKNQAVRKQREQLQTASKQYASVICSFVHSAPFCIVFFSLVPMSARL